MTHDPARPCSAARPRPTRATAPSTASPRPPPAGATSRSASTTWPPARGSSAPPTPRSRPWSSRRGRAGVAAGAQRWGSLGSRTSVFDGPPAPVVLVAARRRRPAHRGVAPPPSWSPPRPRAGPGVPTRYLDPATRRVEHRGAGQHRAHRPPPAAARRARRAADPGRGLHARRQLELLPAPQARHRGAAHGGAAGGALLVPLREARAGVRVRARLHARARPGPVAGAHGRRRGARAARLPPRRDARRLRRLLPERDGRPEPRLGLHRRPRPRLADGLDPDHGALTRAQPFLSGSGRSASAIERQQLVPRLGEAAQRAHRRRPARRTRRSTGRRGRRRARSRGSAPRSCAMIAGSTGIVRSASRPGCRTPLKRRCQTAGSVRTHSPPMNSDQWRWCRMAAARIRAR